MESVKQLKLEHENILRMLKIIRVASLQVLRDEDFSVADFRKFVDFIRLYADGTHHGKEEEYLFKEMEEKLGEAGKNLTRHGMLVEHNLARLYVSNLEDALNRYEADKSDDARLDIIIAAGSYANLLDSHIFKENNVVFPYAERELSEESRAKVEADSRTFEDLDEHREIRDRQLDILDELERKYIG